MKSWIKWEREINNSVQKLNQSLAGINFNRLPDTFIQLGKRPVQEYYHQRI